ncbi:MAG: aminotransferase class III, partial [Bacteroidales bacterium]|nr:aminotransferase class III [Bacteroidales bacterium]
AIGTENKRRWQALADKYGLSIKQWGIPALAGYTFQSPDALAYKTYITQEMLAKGFLAGNSMYTCLAHTPEIIDAYFDALDPIFARIREFEDGRDISKELKGPVCHSGFARLN